METTSKRPYLIRALNEWILDNEMTPHIVVDCTHDGVIVPDDYIKDNKIVLNINPKAAAGLVITNDDITFQARFNGEKYNIFIPCDSVMGIYAKQNGAGMIFTSASDATTPSSEEVESDGTMCTDGEEHTWSDPSKSAPPVVCTKCNVPKIRVTGEKPGLSIVK